MSEGPVIQLFRRDLRLSANPSLSTAAGTGAAVIALFVLDDSDAIAFGGAARWWLHHSLDALGRDLEQRGSSLLLRRSKTFDAVLDLARATGARRVFASRRYLGEAAAADAQLARDLLRHGIALTTHPGSLLREPEQMLAPSTGRPYQVFTPFFRALSGSGPAESRRLPAIGAFVPRAALPPGEDLAGLRLRPTRPDWAAEFASVWRPGEAGAQDALAAFLDGAAANYAENRDLPGRNATSRLSPHLAFGEIAPLEVWRAVKDRADSGRLHLRQAEKFLSELAWREFSHHLLAAFPAMAGQPLRQEFRGFPWSDDDALFDAWSRGATGFPIVDAGMRELWRTGWMHNRVRMIVASFLVKDLLISWTRGEAWFRDTLVDCDPANNIANWQWVAGCGADAAPYFRIFNPTLQGEKFDPDGSYVRAFVPELARLPAEFLHRPSEAPAEVLARAGVRLGENYPNPVVDHARARKTALAALQLTRAAAGKPAE
jgi:deoxyribodipyrimidine photo-lyase